MKNFVPPSLNILIDPFKSCLSYFIFDFPIDLFFILDLYLSFLLVQNIINFHIFINYFLICWVETTARLNNCLKMVVKGTGIKCLVPKAFFSVQTHSKIQRFKNYILQLLIAKTFQDAAILSKRVLTNAYF